MRCFVTSLVILGMAGTAAASPAQSGLTGLFEMRTPEVATQALAYGGLRYARMFPSIGYRTLIDLGYVAPVNDALEWGVQIPVAFTKAGTGLNQPTVSGKYRLVNSDIFQLAGTADLLLPAGIGYSETGTGQLGLGGGIQALVTQQGVQLVLSGNAQKADYCRGCTRASPFASRHAVRGLDSAVGLRVPIESYAAGAEFHHMWNSSNALTEYGKKIDDSDLYVEVGAEGPIVGAWAAKVFLGSGFTESFNTDLFGGFTVSYAIGSTSATEIPAD